MLSKLSRVRKVRSIEWLGSAWKWIAGSPDASDWNAILNVRDNLVENSNQQYKINDQLFETSRKSLEALNSMIEKVNTIDSNDQAATIVLHKTMLLESQVGELSRACQFAKAGLVNSNLLDEAEIQALLKEMDSLPYQSAVEATEFAKPIIVTNGTMLLYVLALPKVVAKEYQMLVIRPAIRANRQIDANFGKLLVAPDETFAITKDCLTIGNTSVCAEEHLTPLSESDCIPRTLKGGNAECHYVTSSRRVVELLEDGTLFLTNYNGTIYTEGQSYSLDGTYLVQFANETVTADNKTFRSHSHTRLIAMPTVVTNLTSLGYHLNLELIHGLSTRNLNLLQVMRRRLTISSTTEIVTIFVVILVIFVFWRKVTHQQTSLETDKDVESNGTQTEDIVTIDHKSA
ncbi:uncharacterized protein LOC122757425 [Drosophila mojavensis]|uniref:uncharacterized protein LOC122757425 n=1 Tax=Drosophila mojavensis TaxID=7230 RepID=UPI001CD08261|nr:uncharacterized protein LOC122757425 [Drosophila mojavensis]